MLMMLLLLSSFTWQTNDKYSAVFFFFYKFIFLKYQLKFNAYKHLWWWWEAYCVTFEWGGFRCCNCLLPS